jgi:hypothetical protein
MTWTYLVFMSYNNGNGGKNFLHRDTGISDFVHRPDSKLLKKQRFGNWISFRPQVREDT